MLVKDWMTTDVITIGPEDTLPDAMRLMGENRIRMLPVVDDGNLIGILSDRDVKRAWASDATTLDKHELTYVLEQIKIKEVMTKKAVTVPFDFTLAETAEVLFEHRISGVPVVDHGGKIVGVITQDDLFREMVTLAGVKERGILFAVEVEDRPGTVRDVTDVIRKYGGRMASIMISYDHVQEGFRRVYIRMYAVDRSRLDQLKGELKAAAKMIYLVDLRENVREIFE
jgi:acetoin utilization protein AcuB